MADIKPFRCIRPLPQLAPRVAALPYDVYSREEAAEEAKKDKLSFLNVDRPETQFGPEEDMYSDKMYQKAHDMLRQEIQDGIFLQDEEPSYYIYELTMEGRTQTGLVACASVEDYQNGVIKKHENTRPEKEEDRIRHVDVCGVQTGPIFLAYRGKGEITEILSEAKKQTPVFAFQSPDGITHRGWILSRKDWILKIQEAFLAISEIYIADGHHRAASAVKVGLKRGADFPEAQYFLSVLFPAEELLILPYNRVVKDLNGRRPEEILEEIGKSCEIRPESAFSQPAEKGTVTLYLAGQWYSLRFSGPKEEQDPVAGLDVSLLQNQILEPIFGIRDPKTDPRIQFVGGIRGMEELKARADQNGGAAFAMYPTSIYELFQVADAGLLMPPKSTWFEPKLRSGLFLHDIGEK